MIKRLMWFTTGLATGAGAVIVLGKKMKRRLAELTPVRLVDRGVQRVKQIGINARQALRVGTEAMREREDELHERVNGHRRASEVGERYVGERYVGERHIGETHVGERSKVIVLPDGRSRQNRSDRASSRSSSPKRSPRKS